MSNFVGLGQTVWTYVGVPNFVGDAGASLLGMWTWLTARNTLGAKCVTIPKFVALGQTVWAQVGLGTLGPRSLRMGTWLTARKMLLHTCVTLPNSVVLC